MVVAAVGLVIGLARRGRLGAVLDVPVRGGPVVLGVLMFDLVILPRLAPLALVEPLLPWLSFASVAGLLVVVLLNWTVFRPLPAWLLGVTMNAVYLLANGGHAYVVRPAAFAASEPLIALPAFVALPFLSAWVPLPPDGWISPGDLVLAVAAAWTVQAAMRYRAA
jgi:hypothetical protein